MSVGRRWWNSEEYAVKKKIIQTILIEFGLFEEQGTETFSTVHNARFKKRLEDDAWRTSWAPLLVCSWNPPYS